MSYLLVQILICLLLSGLVGAFIGWWLRGGCKTQLQKNDDDWNARYEADKAIWHGKIEAAEAQVGDKLNFVNRDWDMKLQDIESTWESKVQGLVGNYNAKINNLNLERETYEEELKCVKNEAREAQLALASINEGWSLKLSDVESAWENKVQSIKRDCSTQVGDTDMEVANLKAALKEQKKKLQESEEKLEKVHQDWECKLQESNSAWEYQIESAKGDFERNQSGIETKVVQLQSDLDSANRRLKDTELKLSQNENEWKFKLKDSESNWNKKIVSIQRDYEAKIGVSKDSELSKLKEELKVTKSKLHQNDEQWSEKLKELQNSTSDLDKLKQKLETELEVAKSEAKKAKAELANANDAWSAKLKSTESDWKGRVQGLMRVDNSKVSSSEKTNAINPEVPSSEILSSSEKVNTMDTPSRKKSSNVEHVNKHLNECFDIEEVEGIGASYAKRLRNMGINTTCDLANKYLRDNKATKRASKKIGVDFDALRAWACMADLMRLPGVDAQYAEIMQTVGLDSRKELTHISLNHLHSLMVEFNSKNPIVPAVPTMDMLVAWSSAAKKQK